MIVPIKCIIRSCRIPYVLAQVSNQYKCSQQIHPLIISGYRKNYHIEFIQASNFRKSKRMLCIPFTISVHCNRKLAGGLISFLFYPHKTIKMYKFASNHSRWKRRDVCIRVRVKNEYFNKYGIISE